MRQPNPELVRRAVRDLAAADLAWMKLHKLIRCYSDAHIEWWWRCIDKIDIPTYDTLKLKVIELRFRQ